MNKLKPLDAQNQLFQHRLLLSESVAPHVSTSQPPNHTKLRLLLKFVYKISSSLFLAMSLHAVNGLMNLTGHHAIVLVPSFTTVQIPALTSRPSKLPESA